MKDTGTLMASLTEVGSAQELIRISLTLISSEDMKTYMGVHVCFIILYSGR